MSVIQMIELAFRAVCSLTVANGRSLVHAHQLRPFPGRARRRTVAMRMEVVVRRMTASSAVSAITEIAHVHAQLNSDPLGSQGFNGILARLLLDTGLGRYNGRALP